MLVYRIQQLKYSESRGDILSGEGAKRLGGRWSGIGTPLIYTAATPELALLEVLVHLEGTPPEDLPPLAIITLQIPDENILKIKFEELPPNWQAVPASKSLQSFSNKWLNEQIYLTLQIPSVVMPKSYNYLLNPLHAALKDVNIIEIEPYNLDCRLLNNTKIVSSLDDMFDEMTEK